MQKDNSIGGAGSEPANINRTLPAPKLEDYRAMERLEILVSVFPTVDPDFLLKKAKEFGFESGSGDKLNRWINLNMGQGCKNLPTRADYQKRSKEAEIIKKFEV